jgi:hypothetical protein
MYDALIIHCVARIGAEPFSQALFLNSTDILAYYDKVLLCILQCLWHHQHGGNLAWTSADIYYTSSTLIFIISMRVSYLLATARTSSGRSF